MSSRQSKKPKQSSLPINERRITLLCIGLLALDEERAALVTMAKGTVTLYCIELDKASALLLSPLYEHIVTLSPAVTARPLGEQARQTLEAVGEQPLYTLTEWHEWICSLETPLTSVTAVNRLRGLLGRTLLVQSRTEAGSCVAINQIYGDNAPVPLLNHCLPTYLKRLDQLRNDQERARSLVTPFWDWVAERDGAQLDYAVDSIFAYVKRGTDFPTLYPLVGLLRRWKSAAKRLLCHKVVEIPRAYTLHVTTRHTMGGGGDLALAESGVAFRLLDIGTCPPQHHLHACTLVPLLWQLLNTPPDKELDQRQLLLAPSLFFVEKQLARGRLAELIHLFYSRYHRRFSGHAALLRERLMEHVLLPLLCEKMERHADACSTWFRATIESVRPSALYHIYQWLFVAFAGKMSDNLDADVVFSLDNDDDDERCDDSVLFKFDLADFRRLLRALDRLVTRQHQQQQRTTYRWIPAPKCPRSGFDQETPLFYIENQPVLTALERKTAALWRTEVIEKALSVEVIGANNDPTATTTMFNEHDERQQFRLIAFSPLQLRRCEDIALMHEQVYDDQLDTAILREASTNHFFRERLARGFESEVTPENWHHELYFESTHFEQIDKRAQRRTVIVADCHLLGAEDMNRLLKWLVFHRQTVRRVLLIGSFDMLPYAQNGQPFLDLMLTSEPRHTQRYLCAHQTRLADFRELLFDESQWVVRPHTTHRSAKDDLGCGAVIGTIYHVDGGGKELLAMLERAPDFQSQRVLRLRQLVRLDRYGDKRPKQRIALEDETVFPLQSKKQRQRILIEPDMNVDALTRHGSGSANGLDVFIVTHAMLAFFSKNQLNLLFSALTALVLVGGDAERVRESIVDVFASSSMANRRLTSNAIY